MKTTVALNSIYISVSNMEKSIALYEQIFGQEVDVYDEELSIFELDNISLLLAKYTPDDGLISFGNSVVLSLDVEDIEEAISVCAGQKLKTIVERSQVDECKVFQVQDYDGNIIEFCQEVESAE